MFRVFRACATHFNIPHKRYDVDIVNVLRMIISLKETVHFLINFNFRKEDLTY